MSSQKGFAHLWLIVGIVAVFVVGGFAFYRVINNEEQTEQNSEEVVQTTEILGYEDCVAAGNPIQESFPEQCTTADGETFIRELTEEEQQALEEASEEPAETPQENTAQNEPPAPAAPAPEPQPNITPYTAADCSGEKTAYVSNPNGTQGSYNPPESWNPTIRFSYGEAVVAYCEIGNTFASPEYVLINDAFVKASDLSTTKP